MVWLCYLCATKPFIVMKQRLLLAFALLVAACAHAQLPQFSNKSFEDWIYSNPATELNSTNILANKIYLYTTSTGTHLTLTSPHFVCHKGETIDMEVTWITDQWQQPNFVVSKVALTAALMDANGVTVDSVTWVPTEVSRTNLVPLSLVVPRTMNNARLRFAAWKGDVNSSGAVRQIVIESLMRGDVDGDGEVTVADINAIIAVILKTNTDAGLQQRADVDGDCEVTVSDINAVIEIIL